VSCQALQEEREEVKRRLEEATARVLQLEDDLIRVTQKGLQKETELDSLKDRVKKLTLEKDGLESHQKDEKDEKELYKVSLSHTHTRCAHCLCTMSHVTSCEGLQNSQVFHKSCSEDSRFPATGIYEKPGNFGKMTGIIPEMSFRL
jgi:chromosome segregation ATPase